MASRLITEADVRMGRITDPLTVDRDIIVTPSALDLLFARGIRVVFARAGDLPRGETACAASPRQDVSVAPSAGEAPSCGCAKADTSAPLPATPPTAVPDRAGARTDRESDWVEVYRRGKTRRFDPTPFRAKVAGGASAAPNRDGDREVMISAIGNTTASAFIERVERLGHHILAFSRRDAHIVARVRLSGASGSIDAAISALESGSTGAELRVHRLL